MNRVPELEEAICGGLSKPGAPSLGACPKFVQQGRLVG